MKKLILLVVFVFSILSVSAQFNEGAPWMKNQYQQKMNNGKVKQLSLPEISKNFNDYWSDKDPSVKGSGYKPFKRWEDHWRHFTNEKGLLPTSEEIWNSWQNHISFGVSGGTDESNWQAFGPSTLVNSATSTANLGRVNVIIPDPNNAATFYVGSPAGGIWKSTDTGLTWSPLSDSLPQIGVSGIAIDPTNSNILYIATGDDDASDTVSAGVFKSTDAGATWNETGLNPSNTPGLMNDIYIHPNNSDILWVATSSGLYKTVDAGDNWTKTFDGNVRDVKIKPADPTVVYVVTSEKFYKSTDTGDTFVQKFQGLPGSSGRFVIDVTPADADYVYLVSSNTDNSYQGLYKSVNSGDSFTKSTNTTNIFETDQAWYDLALAVSDTNAEEIYVGCLNIWKSSDGGTVFTKLNNWYDHDEAFTHADIHFLRFYNNELFAGTDGGFYKSTDAGATFQDFTQGMQISQFYKVAVSPTNSNRMAGGLQDNGGFGYTADGNWSNYHGGDGMDSGVDPNDENIYYGFSQNGGYFNISLDAGVSWSSNYSGPEVGNWVTPLEINKFGVVYAGFGSLYEFTGSGFTKISTEFNGLIDVLEIDPIDPNNIYVGVNKNLYISTDKGVTFTLKETFSANITSIEVNNNDSDTLYVAISGYWNTRHVYRSIDIGENFQDITFNLPSDQAFFDIVHQGEHTENPLFLGTSLGVFRFDDTVDEWQPFFKNLPNVPVKDLEISVYNSKITAATYGRGVWQSDIPFQVTTDSDNDGIVDTADNCPTIANSNQIDTDGDGEGDACDDDDDGDGVLDVNDNCPLSVNSNQSDVNNNGVGDVCEDSDSDSIFDAVDNCPLIANTDQLDTDGDGEGDVCDDDDDNDGVLDTSDNCLLISNANQTDTDGDGEGDVCDDDIDGDGVLNANDNCELVSNADQADFDTDGEGDVCDDDIDGDGVLNVNDNCNDTPLNSVIDVNGCVVYTLPTTNFKLEINSETCRSSNNGSVVLTAVENLNYTAVLVGNGTSETTTFTSTTTFDNLVASSYTVCVTVENQPNYEICFNAEITEPDDLTVYSKVNLKARSAQLSLGGGEKYVVTLNDKTIELTDNFIDLNLSSGVNTLKVTTGVLCQGEYIRTIVVPFEGLKLYPNPVKQNSTLFLTTGDIESKQLKISIYSALGSRVFSKTYANNKQKRIEVGVQQLPKGVYFLQMNATDINKSFTLIIE